MLARAAGGAARAAWARVLPHGTPQRGAGPCGGVCALAWVRVVAAVGPWQRRCAWGTGAADAACRRGARLQARACARRTRAEGKERAGSSSRCVCGRRMDRLRAGHMRGRARAWRPVKPKTAHHHQGHSACVRACGVHDRALCAHLPGRTCACAMLRAAQLMCALHSSSSSHCTRHSCSKLLPVVAYLGAHPLSVGHACVRKTQRLGGGTPHAAPT